MFTDIVKLFVLSQYLVSVTWSAVSDDEANWPYVTVDFPHPVQSPVDIVTSKSTTRILPQLQFASHVSPKVKTVISNNGHTVYIRISDEGNELPPQLIGGPLQTPYLFEQLHMHWGSKDIWGSEHFIDGESFSIEGHAVHYNSKYANFTEAAKYKDGLCVVTIFAEAVDEQNVLLDPLVDILKDISKAGDSVVLSSAKALRWFVSVASSNDFYYTYPGSLTTTPFSENVIFIVFPNHLTLSHEQLHKFRTLHGDQDAYILENYRQLQPLYNRPIIKSYVNPPEKECKWFD